MGKRKRRQSQNSRYMREILSRLREYDLEEIRLLCDRFRATNPNNSTSRRSSTRRIPKNQTIED
jgi:type II secretory pathway pseudopilin PulG